MPVEKGNYIQVEYTGSLEDGTVFDSSEKHGKPLEFAAGEKKVIKGFDEAVLGMEKDEEKEITLKPEQAYGMPNPELIKKFPKEKIPDGQEVKEGMVIGIGLPDGGMAPATITKIEEDHLLIDLNPPLAGKTLKFKIKIVGIGDAPVEKPAAEKPKTEEKKAPDEKPAEAPVEKKDEEKSPAEDPEKKAE